ERVHVTRGMSEDGERDVAAHRQPADDRLVDMKPVEQIDHVTCVIVDRRCGWIGRAAVEPAQLRCNDAPALAGESELTFPHTRVERKGVEKEENAARPRAGGRRSLQISEAAYGGHEPIVNVPPARVESEKPAEAVPATTVRAVVADPRSPI